MPTDLRGQGESAEMEGVRDRMACEVSVSSEPPDWDAYLAGHPAATVFHDVRWGGLMQKTYANHCHYLSARRDGRIAGVVQLIEKRSVLFGRYLCSLPYFDASGILVDDLAAQEALIGQTQLLRDDLDAKWVELRQTEPLEGVLPVRADKVTVRLSLPGSPDELWQQLKPKVRSQVRKAQKEGLSVQGGGGELLNKFYMIYVRNMRDLGSPPHSMRFFRNIVECFGGVVRLFVVRSGGASVAASLTLRDRHGVYVPWAGSDWRFRHLCGNMLLYWTMLADSCGQGARFFDFGRGTRGGGTHRFKVQWGGEERALYWHYLLPEDAELPGLRHDNPKYRFVEACWRRLPLWAVRALGPRIIGNLS